MTCLSMPHRAWQAHVGSLDILPQALQLRLQALHGGRHPQQAVRPILVTEWLAGGWKER